MNFPLVIARTSIHTDSLRWCLNTYVIKKKIYDWKQKKKKRRASIEKREEGILRYVLDQEVKFKKKIIIFWNIFSGTIEGLLSLMLKDQHTVSIVFTVHYFEHWFICWAQL